MCLYSLLSRLSIDQLTKALSIEQNVRWPFDHSKTLQSFFTRVEFAASSKSRLLLVF